ncbi:hypothetical protein LCGC14_2764810, partial [marine sediment metagenome]
MDIFQRANQWAHDYPVEFLNRLFPGKEFSLGEATCPECDRRGKFGILGCYRGSCRLAGPMTPVYFAALVRGSRPVVIAHWILDEKQEKVSDLVRLSNRVKQMAKWHPRIEGEEETVMVPLPDSRRSLNPVAKRYLKHRGLTEKTMERFGLSWCSRGRWRNRIIIPVEDLFFAARTVEPHAIPPYLYPKGCTKSHGLLGFPKGPEIVVVEGPMDAMMWQQWDIPAAAILGGSMSQAQAKRIIRQYRKVTLCFDGDDAGRKGQKQALGMLEGMVEDLTAVWLDDGYDPAEIRPEEVLPGRATNHAPFR